MTHDHIAADLRASCALADQANDNTKTANAYLSLSQTQRRLAHRYRADALKYEAEGNHRNYTSCMHEARRLWNDAKWHLERAKMNRERAMQ
jgi:cellobiose-specific phosphotransferase system component IIA